MSSVASSYQGSKRAACDRCREQKSRCYREDKDDMSDPSKCARCAKAGATCKFSISLRAGRQSVSNSKPPTKRVESSQVVPWGSLIKKPRVYNLDTANHDDDFLAFINPDGSNTWTDETLEDDVTDVGSRRTTLIGDDSHVSNFSDPYTISEAASIFGGEQPNYLANPISPDTGFSGPEDEPKSFVDAPSPMDFEPFIQNYSWGLNPVHSATSEVGQGQDTSLSDCQTPAIPKPSEVRMVRASRMATGETLTNSDEELASIKRNVHMQKRTGDTVEWGGSSKFHSTTLKLMSPKAQDERNKSPASPSSNHDIQHQRMQELSELGLTCYSQVKESTSRDEANPLALSLPNNLAVKVLESSVRFLRLLTALYPSKTPSSMETSHISSSDDDVPTMAKGSQGDHDRKKSSSTSTGDDSNLQPVDMTEIFALLTCYIRILNLHHLLYSRLSNFLITLFQQGAALPPVFPGVHAGSVSLDHFAKFQVKLLIQISTHVLGEIEMALGLPDGYRVSKKNRERQGIFEGSVSVQFIEMTLKEKEKSGLGIEIDRFASIRDHLGRLRQLLKGTINP